MKAAVYAGTRNLYEPMRVAVKSLIANSDVDKVYLLTEDDYFPYKLPDFCENINVSSQRFFIPESPNWNNRCTYMVLIRIALPFILLGVDKVLSLDVDTIVRRDISSIWDINLDSKYLAGVPETKKSNGVFTYINNGVALYNLKLLRESGKAQEMINELNTVRYPDTEQDVINLFCQGKIVTLPACYNANDWTDADKNVHIIHYAGRKSWSTYPEYREYEKLDWDFVMKWRRDRYNK